MIEFLIDVIRTSDPGDQFILAAFVGLGTPFSLYAYIKNLRRARLIEDIPTSRIRSAAQGFVEIEGHGRGIEDAPIISPLTGTQCLWWRYIIEKKVMRNKKSNWVVVDTRTSDALFMLEDETGTCLIDPEGAEVHPSKHHTWYGRSSWPKHGPNGSPFSLFANHRYQELLVFENEFLYTLGLFRTQRASDGHFDESSEVSALMKEWKEDHDLLMKRFDVDKDGQISPVEWEAARRVALKKVRESQMERSTSAGLHILSQPTDHKDFIISTTSQHDIIRRYRLKSMGFLVLFLTGAAGLALMLLAFDLI